MNQEESKMVDMSEYSSVQARLKSITLPEKPQPRKLCTEAALKKAVEKDVRLMLDTFTEQENMQMAFTPLIVAAIVWIYADKARNYAVEHKLDGDFKKLTRWMKSVREEYRKTLRKDLDPKHIRRMDDGAKRFMDENSNDFNVLWFSVNNEIKKRYPDLTHQPMRTDAYIARALIRFLNAYNKATDEMMRSRLKNVGSTMEDPHLKCLSEILRALSGNIVLDGQHLKNCMLILNRNLRRIEYNID